MSPTPPKTKSLNPVPNRERIKMPRQHMGIVTVIGGASVSVAPQLVAFQTIAPVTLAARQDISVVPPVNAALHECTSQIPVVQAGWKEAPVKHMSTKPAKLKVRPHAKTPRNTMAAIAAPIFPTVGALQPVNVAQRETAPTPEVLLFVVQTQQADASGMGVRAKARKRGLDLELVSA